MSEFAIVAIRLSSTGFKYTVSCYAKGHASVDDVPKFLKEGGESAYSHKLFSSDLEDRHGAQ